MISVTSPALRIPGAPFAGALTLLVAVVMGCYLVQAPVVVRSGWAPPGPPPGAVPADPPQAIQVAPGLQLTLTSSGPGKELGARDRRVARLAALQVAAQGAPSPFLAPGEFTATFDGWLVLDAWSLTTFSLEGLGAAELSINGTEVLRWPAATASEHGKEIRLNKGRNRFQLTYHSQSDGAGNVRLFWASAEFPREPVPPTVFVHDAQNLDLDRAAHLRHGRELVGTLHCTKCHQSEASAASGMPELGADAPDLRQVGARLQTGWMARWIADPQALRPHAAMPRVLDPAQAARQAADIAAYLTTLGTPESTPAFTPEEVSAGARQFAGLGCIACHGARDKVPADIDLREVPHKWQGTALIEFLEQPTRHYRWIPMPTFGLTKREARQLAAYLMAQESPAAPAALPGDPARGRTLALATGCTACHALGEGQAPSARPLAEVRQHRESGCLATTPSARGRAPDFALDAETRSDLRAFLDTDLRSLGRRTLGEFAARQVQALRCTACHERDGVDAHISAFGSEIDALLAANPAPEPPAGEEHAEGSAAAGNPCPNLTFVGDKLRPAWLTKLFAGTLPYRTRPWLTKRMPAFPAVAELLAQGLAEEYGHPTGTAVPVASPAATAEIGRQLVGSAGGLSCGACHGLGSQPPLAVFEAPGVNLGYATDRLQPDFFHRWMLAPLRFDATTRMPKFAADDGTMPMKDILGGKADEQFIAIWRYLTELNQQTDFPH